jgi:hypothetical protein
VIQPKVPQQQNTSYLLMKTQDPLFGWPIETPNAALNNPVLGYCLAFLAILTASGGLMTFTSLEKAKNGISWPWILLWQGLGGLFAASIGK